MLDLDNTCASEKRQDPGVYQPCDHLYWNTSRSHQTLGTKEGGHPTFPEWEILCLLRMPAFATCYTNRVSGNMGKLSNLGTVGRTTVWLAWVARGPRNVGYSFSASSSCTVGSCKTPKRLVSVQESLAKNNPKTSSSWQVHHSFQLFSPVNQTFPCYLNTVSCSFFIHSSWSWGPAWRSMHF